MIDGPAHAAKAGSYSKGRATLADKKGGKNEPSADDIMSAGELKPILAQAKKGNPASVAIALSKDKDSVMLADKRKKPKKLMAEMKQQAGTAGLELDTTSMRFGRATVDPEKDAALLTLTVNKDASGAMRPKLLELLKKAGFSKLEIVVDAALENESEDETLPDTPTPDTAPADTQSAGSSSAAASSEQPTQQQAPSPAGPAPAPAQAAPPAAAPDLSALTGRLTALVRDMAEIIKVTPTLAAPLKAVATDAQLALKSAMTSGDTAPVTAGIEALEQALASAAAQPGADAPRTFNVSTLTKASKAWLATRKKVESDIAKLRDSFAEAFKDHEHVDALTSGFEARVETVLTGLDDELAHRLAEVSSTNDPTEHAKVVDDAKKIITRYDAFLAADPTIAEIDANPSVPLAIQKTLTVTLEILNRAVV